jgi:hypothetical protein
VSPTTDCVQCHAAQPTADRLLCPTCTAQLRTWLLELAGHASDLEEVVVAGLTSRRGERVQVRGEGETPMPFNENAANTAWVLHNDLVALVRDITETRGIEYRGVDKSAALAAWLAKNVMCIALDVAALETWSILESLAVGWTDAEGQWHRSLVLCAVDIPPTRMLLGPCDGYVGVHRCEADLRAVAGAKVVACSTCQTKHDVADYQARVLARMGDSLMTAAELAGAVRFSGGPKADTITKWKRRGQRMPSGEVFVAHGETPEGADLFRVCDFLAMTAKPMEDARAA